MTIRPAVFLFVVLTCFSVHLHAQMPQAAHPRIFLDDSTITQLKMRVAANTPEWQSIREYLTNYATEAPWGTQFLDGIPTFALAYLLTGDTTYANRALYFLDNWVTTLKATQPFEVSGDDYAHLYETVGIGYDWLYNYPGFSATKKRQVFEMMNRVFLYGQTSWENGGGDFEVDPHDSDQIIGGAKTAFIWGAATYGDNPEAETMIKRSRELWKTFVNRWILRSIGGVWPEGSQYSYNTLGFLLSYSEAERTATGKDYWTENPTILPFPKNVIRALLWLTPPGNDHLLTYNDQEDDNAHYWGRRNHTVALATFIAERLGFSEEAAYGRYWIRELCPNNLDMNLWQLFLWYDRSKPHTNYFTQNLPGTYFSAGTDWSFLRSNWTKQTSYSTFSATWTNVDHQFSDGGHFNIWRNGEYLTRQVRHYDFVFTIDGKEQRYDGEASNILLIQSDYEDDSYVNRMGSPEFFESAGEPKITRYRSEQQPLFAYSFAKLGESYNRLYDQWGGNSSRVTSYTRQFVQIAPDFYIVYDRVRTQNAGWVRYVLHSLTEPMVTGKTVKQMSKSGTQWLVQRTLFPDSVHIEKINEAVVWNTAHGLQEDWMLPQTERNWHVTLKPPDSNAVNFLNVIETGSGSDSTVEKARPIEGNDFLGVQMGRWIVLFAKEENHLSHLSYPFSAAGQTYHLVCDLDSNQTFKIEQNGQPLQLATTASDGTLFFTTQSAGQKVQISIEKSTTAVGQVEKSITDFRLFQNYPNPFTPGTTLGFSLFHESFVSLKIFNALGEEVADLVHERKLPGTYKIHFAAKGLPNGVYFCQFRAGNFLRVKKMVIQR